MSVEDYVGRLLGREGGYVNHPADKGGETNWGITVSVARAFGYAGPMRDMPKLTAYNIYLERYWKQPGFDRVWEHAPQLAEEMLDTGVNMGTGTAVKFLQRALNVLNLQEKTFPDLEPDGVLGRMTIAAIKAFLAHRGLLVGQQVLLRMVDSQQSVRYIELAEKNRSQETFQFGWQHHRVGGHS